MRATSSAFLVCLSFSFETQQKSTDASRQDERESLDYEAQFTERLKTARTHSTRFS